MAGVFLELGGFHSLWRHPEYSGNSGSESQESTVCGDGEGFCGLLGGGPQIEHHLRIRLISLGSKGA